MTPPPPSVGSGLEAGLGSSAYLDVFAWTGDALVVADAEGRYLDANHAATALLGYDREELLQLRVADVVARQPEWTEAEYTRFQQEGHWRGEVEVRRKDGTLVPVEALATVAPLSSGTVYVSALRDMREHTRLAAELAARARQQAVVADLGRRALTEVDLDALLSEAVAVVAATLDVEYSKVLERLPGGEALRLRAGVGWREGLVGEATVGAGTDSQAGYTLFSDEPVIVADLSTETRFSGPPLLHEHGVVSGLSTVIRGRERPFGVLGAHTRARRDFTQDDASFLRSVANVLAAAIDRQHLEDEVREDRFRALVEHASDLIAVVDGDGIRRYASPSYESILGYRPAELVGHSVTKLDHPDDAETDRRFFAELARKPGATGRVETRVRDADGSWRWVEVIATNRLTDPAVRGIVVNARDITERKRMEAALQAAKEAWQRSFDALPDHICVLDRSGAILQANQTMRDRFEPIHGSLIGLDYRLIYCGSATPSLPPPCAAVLAGGPAVAVETALPTMTGQYLVASYPIEVDGERQGAVSVVRDITERARLEQEVYTALEAAQAGNRAQRQFLTMMSHELRSPMQTVLGYADLLLTGGEPSLTPEQIDGVQTIRRGAERMMVLLSQMLDLARLEAGRMELGSGPVDLSRIIMQVRQEVAPHAAIKGLELHIDLPPELPPVRGDTGGIQQILLNLAGNAVKFTEEGAVHLAAAVTDGEVAVAVRDTGAGIAPEALPYIFEEFRQVDSGMTRRYEGAGLGLAIAKLLAEQMGGRIAVESCPAVGSTFTLHLRATDGSPAGDPDGFSL